MAVHWNGHGIWYGQEESENRRIKDDEDNSIADEIKIRNGSDKLIKYGH